MVDFGHSLVALANSTAAAANAPEETYQNGYIATTFSREASFQWAHLEKTSRLRSRQNFFLDIPFNRTH